MVYTVIISAAAEADLIAIYDYIAARTGDAIAQRFVDRIESYVLGFANMPERGTRRDDLRPRRRTVGFRRRATTVRGRSHATARDHSWRVLRGAELRKRTG
jgi:toxin ParE1/3/4